MAGQKRQTQQWVCKDRKYRELKGSREMANPVQGSAHPKKIFGGKPMWQALRGHKEQQWPLWQVQQKEDFQQNGQGAAIAIGTATLAITQGQM